MTIQQNSPTHYTPIFKPAIGYSWATASCYFMRATARQSVVDGVKNAKHSKITLLDSTRAAVRGAHVYINGYTASVHLYRPYTHLIKYLYSPIIYFGS